jgi:hypothetical protein
MTLIPLAQVAQLAGVNVETARKSYRSLKPDRLRAQLVDGVLMVEEEEAERWVRERVTVSGWRQRGRR